jgi:23S rRNA (adenine1618-N6)-methyltransferase
VELNSPSIKTELHPRNQHRDRYDFDLLMAVNAALKPFVKPNKFGDASIDFANPQAVKALNQALLKQYYDVAVWDIPPQYLCPPIPGRADYLHYLADLLAESPLENESIRVLDIGVGANMIYPLIGQHTYGWQFVGADIDIKAIKNAQKIVDANGLDAMIDLRLQSHQAHFFKHIIQQNEHFTFTMCNPPFHASVAEAQAGTQRKWRGLGRGGRSTLNFGGQSNELIYDGGEAAFVTAMMKESKQYATQCDWFTTLLSKAANLPSVYRTLQKVGARTVKTINMQQGQKQSRMVAWTFIVSSTDDDNN